MGILDDQAPLSPNSSRPRGRSATAPTPAEERVESATRLTALDVMTVGEVAELLHVPESTVGDWARRRVIPSLKLGRRRIFIRSKIEAILLAD
jgi:excisionase family DNA binding protein